MILYLERSGRTLVEIGLITGANPTVFEVDGEQLTPLDYAVIGQHQEVATLLIENGALSISLVRDLAAILIQKVCPPNTSSV